MLKRETGIDKFFGVKTKIEWPEIGWGWVHGRRAILIDEERLALLVETTDQDLRVRLKDLHPAGHGFTAWIRLTDPEKLRASPEAKPIRDMLKREYPDTWRQVLSRIIELIEDRAEDRSGTNEEERVKVIYTPVVVGDGYIAEEVWNGVSSPRYVVKRFDSDIFEEVEEIDSGLRDAQGRHIVYRPVDNDHLRKGLVLLPEWPEPCSFGEVIDEAFRFLLNPDYYDPVGQEAQVKLLGLICIASWFLDKLTPETPIPIAGIGRFAPIIAIRGPSETGKNRLANLLRFLSYRPYFDLSKTRIPSLYRPLDLWKGTLVMDEADFKHSGETSQLIHFLNSRATGTPISRQNPENPRVGEAFESFGLTIVTQRRHFDDNATESRCIPYQARKSPRIFKNDENEKIPSLELDELVKEGLKLQNRLLYLRLTYWPKLRIDKRAWVEGLTDPRLNAALLPLLALAEYEPRILEVIKETIKPLEEAKRRMKAQSPDGQLINEIWSIILDGGVGRWGPYIYLAEPSGAEADLPPITRTKLAERLNWKLRQVSKTINSLLSMPNGAPERIKVLGKDYRPIWLKPEDLEPLLREFVLDYEAGSLFLKLRIGVGDKGDKGDANSLSTEKRVTADVREESCVASVASVAESLTEDEELLAKLVESEGSIGLMLLRDWSDLPKDRFEAALRSLEEKGLIALNRGLGTASWRLRP